MDHLPVTPLPTNSSEALGRDGNTIDIDKLGYEMQWGLSEGLFEEFEGFIAALCIARRKTTYCITLYLHKTNIAERKSFPHREYI